MTEKSGDELIYKGHKAKDHPTSGIGREKKIQIISRYLCGWVTGHGAPLGHFDKTAEAMLKEIENA